LTENHQNQEKNKNKNTKCVKKIFFWKTKKNAKSSKFSTKKQKSSFFREKK
tara:strand:+ start:84 stop:236 length:153 start_codon:yes stop_codon:yes gene_type:complete